MREYMPRIHVIPETEHIGRPNACAALRLLDPFSHNKVLDRFDVSVGATLPTGQVDAVVMQRLGRFQSTPIEIEALVADIRSRGARLIYDLDDNLLDEHPDPALEAIIGMRRRIARFFLRESDHVTVSTRSLQERVQGISRRVSLIPNLMDERRLSDPARPPSRGGPLKIGYFGTFTHLRDLLSVAAPIRAALSKLNGVTLVLCGISLDSRMAGLFDGLATIETLPATGDYDSFIAAMVERADWDIGLAPLAAGAFEASKSDIKFLEYAAFGIPGVYSQHDAYGAVEHGRTGLVCAPDDWAQAIVSLAHDPGLRAAISANARTYLFSQRTLSAAGNNWADMLATTLGTDR